MRRLARSFDRSYRKDASGYCSGVESNSRFAPNCHGSYAIRSVGPLDRAAANVRKLLDLGLARLDFSTMPAQILAAITEDWMRRFSNPHRTTPIVAIAHTKNWTERSMRHLTDYLTWARGAGIRFSTYSEWLELVNSKAPSKTTGSHAGEPDPQSDTPPARRL
jgi:hypothetical protein